MSVLIARDLSVRKGDRTVLHAAEFACKAGECLVVLGENGSGKSVMLRSLALSEPGAYGTIDILGSHYRLEGAPAEEGPWPDLTIVLQSLALWPHLSAGENVLMPWRRRDPTRRLSRADLKALFVALEIDTLVGRYPAELSGGQRQRVAIARSIALRPSVLLLDEPSAALDARQSASVLTRLGSLKAEGVAIILVTHSLGFAAKIADKYIFLHEGRLIDGRAWAELANSPSAEVRDYLDLNSF